MVKYEKTDTLKIQVVQAGSCLPIFNLEIWDTQNKRKSPHDRKESVSIVKGVMESEASKERLRTQIKVEKAKKYIDNREKINAT